MEPGRHPLRGIRRVTAETMARSWSEIPHLTTLDEIDATGLLAARQRLADAGIDITIGALLVAAVARGLRRYPVFNASLETPRAARAGRRNHRRPPRLQHRSGSGDGRRSRRAGDHAGRPAAPRRSRRRGPAAHHGGPGAPDRRRRSPGRDLHDLQLGALGGRYATPLIRPPEVGIMGFGAIEQRPFVVDGEVRARPTLPWSLSADHRLIDGDVATGLHRVRHRPPGRPHRPSRRTAGRRSARRRDGVLMVVGEVAVGADLLVIGGGPGGYSAALRAAAAGRTVTLVERDRLGGVLPERRLHPVQGADPRCRHRRPARGDRRPSASTSRRRSTLIGPRPGSATSWGA